MMNRLFCILLAIVAMGVMPSIVSASEGGVVISEIAPIPAGADPSDQSVELLGTPGATFDLWILSVESDCGSSQGVVDRATNIMGMFDANGVAVVMIPDLENPSNTVILTDAFTGATGTTDIDVDDDGIPETITDLGAILDAIGIPDNAGDEACIYGVDLGGADFTYTGSEPALIFRDGVTGDWYAVHGDETVYDVNAMQLDPADFDILPVSTGNFGSINPTYIEPTAVTLSDVGTDSDSIIPTLAILAALLSMSTVALVSNQE